MVSGYFSFGDDVPQFIALREPLDGSLDIWMTIGQFGLFFGLIIGVIIRLNCNKDTGIFIKCLI